MKKLFILSIAIGVVFASCSHYAPSPYEDTLYQVECFLQVKPDSAMKVLDNFDITQLSERERAHHNLLKAQAIGFLRLNEATADSLLNEAEKYYSKSDDKYHEAMTYWQRSSSGGLLGYGAQYTMDYRQKALQTIEQCNHVDPRQVQYSLIPTNEQNEIDRLKYAIHQRLGMSYSSSGYHREGIKHLLLSEQYYDKQKRYNLHLASCYMLANAYTVLNEFDSSMLYLKKGLESAEITGNVAECGYYYYSVAEFSLYRYETQTELSNDEQLQLLLNAVDESQTGLEILGDTDERMVNSYRLDLYENLARAYCFLQKYDSCIYYGTKVFDFYGDKTSEFQLKYLYKAYKALGDTEKTVLFADLLLNVPNDYGTEQKAIAEVKDEYDHKMELQQIENQQHMQRLQLFLIIAALIIVILLLWLFISRLRTENERIRHSTFGNLLNRARKIYSDNKEDSKKRILSEFNANYPNVINKIKLDYPELNSDEINILILSMLSFRIKEISQIMGFKESTILKYRTNIRKKTESDDLNNLIRAKYIDTNNLRYNMKKVKLYSVFAFLFLMTGLQAQNTIEVSGTYYGNVFWEADTVKIVGNVLIEKDENPSKLIVVPGTYVEAQGYYRITLHNCSLFAEGTEDAPIVFTAHDLTNFNNQSYESGWQGFFVLSEPNMNDSLVMDYCTISYAKVTDGTPEDERNGAGLHINTKKHCRLSHCTFSNNRAYNTGVTQMPGNGGGGVYMMNPGECVVEHCYFTNNYACWGGGMILSGNHTFKIHDCEFVANSSSYGSAFYMHLGTGAAGPNVYNNYVHGNYGQAVYLSWDVKTGRFHDNIIVNNEGEPPLMGGTSPNKSLWYNNTIVLNQSSGFMGIQCGGVWTVGEQIIFNNIIYANGNSLSFGEIQFDYDPVNGAPTVFNNCMSYYHNYPGTVYDEPEFVDPAFGLGPAYDKPDADWSLRDNSPCINAGSMEQSGYPATDIYGNPRIYGGVIDIGAVENQRFDGIIDLDENGIVVYPNPGHSKLTVVMADYQDVMVYDALGRSVYAAHDVDVVAEIDAESWNSGIYFLKIYKKNGETTTQKWIKQ